MMMNPLNILQQKLKMNTVIVMQKAHWKNIIFKWTTTIEWIFGDIRITVLYEILNCSIVTFFSKIMKLNPLHMCKLLCLRVSFLLVWINEYMEIIWFYRSLILTRKFQSWRLFNSNVSLSKIFQPSEFTIVHLFADDGTLPYYYAKLAKNDWWGRSQFHDGRGSENHLINSRVIILFLYQIFGSLYCNDWDTFFRFCGNSTNQWLNRLWVFIKQMPLLYTSLLVCSQHFDLDWRWK